jgi:hypothetical protein
MAKLHGGTHHIQGSRHGAPKPRIYANHGGTNHQMGKVHDAPTRGGAVNDKNYSNHKIKRK